MGNSLQRHREKGARGAKEEGERKINNAPFSRLIPPCLKATTEKVNRVDFLGFWVSEREIREKNGEEICEEGEIEIVITGRMDISR